MVDAYAAELHELRVDQDNLPERVQELLTKRSAMEGASSSAADFKTFFNALSRDGHDRMEQAVPIKRTERHLGIMASLKGMLDSVSSENPQFPPDVKRVVVASLCIFRRRYKDVFMRENVELLHALLGGDYIRSHDGKVVFKHEQGNWEAYGSMVPEIAFSKLRERVLVLEGVFLTIPPNTARTVKGVTDAVTLVFNSTKKMKKVKDINGQVLKDDNGKDKEVVDYMSKFEELENKAQMRTDVLPGGGFVGQRPGRGGGGGRAKGKGRGGAAEEEPAPRPVLEEADESHLPWPKMVSNAVARMGGSMQQQLLGKTLISYYSEWCDTPCEKQPGIAYKDTIILYDYVLPGGRVVNVHFIKTDEVDHNVYLGCPSHILTGKDPYVTRETEWLSGIIGPWGFTNDHTQMELRRFGTYPCGLVSCYDLSNLLHIPATSGPTLKQTTCSLPAVCNHDRNV